MSLLKPPLKHRETTTLQIVLGGEVCHTLKKYAEFIDAKPSYVVGGALKLLFAKDAHFNRWLADYTQSRVEQNSTLKLSNDALRPESFEPLISSSQAAELMGGIHVKTMQRYAKSRVVPAYRIGDQWFFRTSELNAWLRQRNSKVPTG